MKVEDDLDPSDRQCIAQCKILCAPV